MKFPSACSLSCILALVSTAATVCAWTINRLLERRQSAALRHFFWLLALTAPLAAVPLSLLPARVHVPLLAAPRQLPAAGDSIPRRPVIAATQPVEAARGPLHPALLPPPAHVAKTVRPTFGAWPISLWPVLWLGVAGGLLIRLCAGTISVTRSLKIGCVPAGSGLLARLRESAAALRLTHLPRLFVSRAGRIPFCCGILRPAIVIPEDIADENHPLLAFCLKHELAHIIRRDLLCLFAAYLGCALCWFNPLMWLALRRLRDEAEAAADDLVLAHHPQPDDYAAGLLSIAETSGRAGALPLVFSMARPKGLRRRLVAILDATRPRRAPARGTLAALGVLAVLALCVCLSVRLAAAEPTPASTPANSTPAASPTPATASGAAGLPYESGTFKVRVVNGQDQPIRDAKVLPDNCVANATSTSWCDPATGERASAAYHGFLTGADGEATVPYPIFLNGTNHELRTESVSYHVWADGYGEATGTCQVSEGVSEVTLVKGTTVTLHAISPTGAVLPKPRAVLSRADSGEQWMEWRHASDEAALVSARPFTPGTHYVMAVTADAAGVLSFSEVREFTTAETIPQLTLDLPVQRGREVTGVLDASVPRPVQDGRVMAFVVPKDGRDAKGRPIEPGWMACAAIRADGTFTLTNLPPGELHATAVCDGFVTANEKHIIVIEPQAFAADAALPLVLKMEATGDVRVKVHQADGSPLAGAEVGFWPNEECDLKETTILGNAFSSVGEFDWEYREKFSSHETLAVTRVHQYAGRTDAQGEAVIFDLPMGKKEFQITKPGGHSFERASVNVEPGRETTVVVETKSAPETPAPSAASSAAPAAVQAGTITGRVVAQKTGEPLAEVLIRAAVGEDVDMRTNRHPDSGCLETRTDRNGEYRLSVPLSAGEHLVQLDALVPGYRSSAGMLALFGGDRASVTLSPGGTGKYDFKLSEALYLKGIVVDEAGQPVRDANIETTLSLQNGCGYVAETRTAADGGFEVFDFPPQMEQGSRAGGLTANHRDYIAAMIANVYSLGKEEQVHLKLVLPKGRQLTGTLFDAAGKPAPVVEVTAHPVQGGGETKRSVTDRDGKLALRGLRADADYVVTAHALSLKEKYQARMRTNEDHDGLALHLTPIVLKQRLQPIEVLGMQLVDLTDELRAVYDYDFDVKGALLLNPGKDSARFQIGELKEGQVFWLVEDVDYKGTVSIASVRQFVDAIVKDLRRNDDGTFTCRVVYTMDPWSTNTQYLRVTEREAADLKALAAKLAAGQPPASPAAATTPGVTTSSSTTPAKTPSLKVGIVLLKHSAAGDNTSTTLTRTALLLESGRQGTLTTGKFECQVTPTLLDNGFVDVNVILTEHDGDKAIQVVDQSTKAKLGHATEFRVDQLVFQTTTSLAE